MTVQDFVANNVTSDDTFNASQSEINTTPDPYVDPDAGPDGWIADDASWILCASFVIFTMQTG